MGLYQVPWDVASPGFVEESLKRAVRYPIALGPRSLSGLKTLLLLKHFMSSVTREVVNFIIVSIDFFLISFDTIISGFTWAFPTWMWWAVCWICWLPALVGKLDYFEIHSFVVRWRLFSSVDCFDYLSWLMIQCFYKLSPILLLVALFMSFSRSRSGEVGSIDLMTYRSFIMLCISAETGLVLARHDVMRCCFD